MKKIAIVLIVLLFTLASLSASMLGDSVQKGKFSVGASFGTSGSSEKSFNGSKSVAVQTGNFGFVGRLRFDAMIAEKQSTTVMASIDKPNRTVLASSYEEAENSADPVYVKLFIGISQHSVSSDNLLIAVGVGPEVAYDFKTKMMSAGPATYIRTSYAITGTRLTFDSTAKGSATWQFKDIGSLKDGRLCLDGDVSFGFTYYF